jgi:hypothetical protein
MRRPRPNWRQLREQLWERSGGFCEISGVALDAETFDAHHRRNLGAGGTSRPDADLLTNLLALDPAIHNAAPSRALSVHGNAAWSMPLGYLLYQVQVPADEPVYLRECEWVLLTEDGRYEPTNSPIDTPHIGG